jgi:hypothetical protein
VLLIQAGNEFVCLLFQLVLEWKTHCLVVEIVFL